MSRSLADALEKLLGAGGRLAASQLTAAQRGALEEFARRTLAVRLAVSGRGSLYEIAALEQVQAHLAQLRPGHTENAASVIPQRALNMSRNRDSKSGSARHSVQYLLLKAVNDGQYWRDGKGQLLDVSQLTQTCGAAALAVQSGDDWHTASPLWLIENQALFGDISWRPADASGTLRYYSGQLQTETHHRSKKKACLVPGGTRHVFAQKSVTGSAGRTPQGSGGSCSNPPAVRLFCSQWH